MKFAGGLPETLCGSGSTLAATRDIRESLPSLLRILNVKILLDAPCGDMHWISHVDLSGIAYIGADISDENLAAARARNGTVVLHKMDIVSDPLPPADAMLCRDFHQHLPSAMVTQALQNFARSGIRKLIATRHHGAENIDLAQIGGFREIDLCHWLEPPFMEISDYGRRLSVWTREQVMAVL